MERETVIYQGKKYHRYPSSARRQHRVYFYRHDKWKTSPVALHTQIYIDTYGPIPQGYHVHHKDGNPLNNEPSNLEAISVTEHRRKHPISNAERLWRYVRGKLASNLVEWQREHREEFIKQCRINGKKSQGLIRWTASHPELASKIYSEAGKRSKPTRNKTNDGL